MPSCMHLVKLQKGQLSAQLVQSDDSQIKLIRHHLGNVNMNLDKPGQGLFFDETGVTDEKAISWYLFCTDFQTSHWFT